MKSKILRSASHFEKSRGDRATILQLAAPAEAQMQKAVKTSSQ